MKPRPSLDLLLVLTPVAIGMRLFGAPDLAIFLTSAAAIVPLAGLIGRATEQLALHTGPRIGGLVNATFGNVTELIIAVFLILDDRIEMVKASLTGSILGNLLLVLGLSLFVGGLKHDRQSFNARSASVHATSLALAVTGLLMPALFSLGTRATFAQREVVSGVVAGVLILMYIAALVFTLVTHEHLFRTPQEDETPAWSRRKAVVVLLITTGFVALMSEFLVSSLEPALETLGLSELFVGLDPHPGDRQRGGALVRGDVRAAEQGGRDARDRRSAPRRRSRCSSRRSSSSSAWRSATRWTSCSARSRWQRWGCPRS